MPATILKRRFQHRCFPVKIANFLRTLILKNICAWWRRCGVFIVNFEHISHFALVFLLWILNMWLPAGMDGKRKLLCYIQTRKYTDKIKALYLYFTEAVTRRCSVKKLFLKISQSSQESTCVGVSFLIIFFSFFIFLKRGSNTGVFL